MTVTTYAAEASRRQYAGETYEQIAESLGVNANTLRGAVGRYRRGVTLAEDRPPTEHIIPIPDLHDPQFDEESGVADVVSADPQTLEDLLAATGIDQTVWRVRKPTVNFYAGNWQVKAELERIVPEPVQATFEDMLAQLREAAPVYPKLPVIIPPAEYLLVLHCYDIHFGKLNTDRVSLENVAAEFRAVVDALLGKALGMGRTISRVLIPLGHDALHVEGMSSATTRNTPQDMSVDPRLMDRVARDAFIYLVEQAAEIAPVDVVCVPGNHAERADYDLGLMIEARFSKHPRVSVRVDLNTRHYYTFGSTLLGMTHGDKEKAKELAELMPVEAPEAWGASSYRKWFLAHLHALEVTQHHGVVIQRYPALSRLDRWHEGKGYVGNQRAAMGEFIHHDHGPELVYTVFTDEVAAPVAQAA